MTAKKQNKCQCEEDGRVHGTVRSTRLEDAENDIFQLKEKMKWVRDLYERIDRDESRIAKLESPPNWETRLKRKIIRWLDFWNN